MLPSLPPNPQISPPLRPIPHIMTSLSPQPTPQIGGRLIVYFDMALLKLL